MALRALQTFTSGTLVAATLFSPAALAATTTWDVSFSASNFFNQAGSDPSPLTQVTGSFTVTFDPLIPILVDTSNGLVLNSLNFTLDPPFVFNNFAFSVGANGNANAVSSMTN